MNTSVLFWALVVVTYLAGVGTVPVIQMFRAPHPGHRAKTAETGPEGWADPAGPPVVRPGPAPTRHHGRDTMDVLAEGYAAGRGDRLQFGTAGAQGWESGAGGPAPGQDATWAPDPYRNGGGHAAVPGGRP